MKVTIIPIVIGGLDTVTKIEGQEDLEITNEDWPNFCIILRRMLETWGDLQLLKLQ